MILGTGLVWNCGLRRHLAGTDGTLGTAQYWIMLQHYLQKYVVGRQACRRFFLFYVLQFSSKHEAKVKSSERCSTLAQVNE